MTAALLFHVMVMPSLLGMLYGRFGNTTVMMNIDYWFLYVL